MTPAFKIHSETIWGWRGRDLYCWFFKMYFQDQFKSVERFMGWKSMILEQIKENI